MYIGHMIVALTFVTRETERNWCQISHVKINKCSHKFTKVSKVGIWSHICLSTVQGNYFPHTELPVSGQKMKMSFSLPQQGRTIVEDTLVICFCDDVSMTNGPIFYQPPSKLSIINVIRWITIGRNLTHFVADILKCKYLHLDAYSSDNCC